MLADRASAAGQRWHSLDDSPTRTPGSSVDGSIWLSERFREVNRQHGFADCESPASVDEELAGSWHHGAHSPNKSPGASATRLPLFRRRTHGQVSPLQVDTAEKPSSANVTICIRARRVEEGKPTCLAVQSGGKSTGVSISKPDGREAFYTSDAAFGPDASQEAVFQEAAAPVCEAALSGYSGAVIAYGQTGSGKTYTMVGDSQNVGLIPLGVQHVYDGLVKLQNCSVEVSVLEVYNERVRDLLSPEHVCVDIHEAAGEKAATAPAFHCPDAVRRQADTAVVALAALTDGLRRREMAPTEMNQSSSRSHLIFSLHISHIDEGVLIERTLRFVDLAGSERLKRSHSYKTIEAAHTQIREAGAINKSLSQLAIVIQRLTSGSGHVPYRSSVLTKLLSSELGGGAKTTVVINVSPLLEDLEETACALDFGKRAGLVRNTLRASTTDLALGDVQRACMQKEISFLKQEQSDLQSLLQEALREKAEMREKWLHAVQLGLSEIVRAEAPSSLNVEHIDRSKDPVQIQLDEMKAELHRTRAILADAGRSLSALVDLSAPLADEHPNCLSGLWKCVFGGPVQ